jgi:hypothetical protein
MRPSLTTDDQHHLTIAEMIAGTYDVYFVDQLNQGDTTFSTLNPISCNLQHYHI